MRPALPSPLAGRRRRPDAARRWARPSCAGPPTARGRGSAARPASAACRPRRRRACSPARRPAATGGVRAADGLGGAAGQPGAGRGRARSPSSTRASATPPRSSARRRAPGRRRRHEHAATTVTVGHLHRRVRPRHLHGHRRRRAAGRAGLGGSRSASRPGATVLVVKVADARRHDLAVAGPRRARLGGAAPRRRSTSSNLSLSHERPGDGYGADPLTDAVEQVRRRRASPSSSPRATTPTASGTPASTPARLAVGAADLRDPGVAGFSGSGTAAGRAAPRRRRERRRRAGPGAGRLASSAARSPPRERGLVPRQRAPARPRRSSAARPPSCSPSTPRPPPRRSRRPCAPPRRNLPGDRDGAGLLQVPRPAAERPRRHRPRRAGRPHRRGRPGTPAAGAPPRGRALLVVSASLVVARPRGARPPGPRALLVLARPGHPVMAPARAVRLAGAAWVLLAGAVAALAGWGGAPWWAPLLLAGGVAASETAVVHLQFGRQRWTFSLTEAVLAAALVAAAGAWVVVGVALGVLGAQLLRDQPAPQGPVQRRAVRPRHRRRGLGRRAGSAAASPAASPASRSSSRSTTR